jgi:hypothetical protein
MLFSASMDPFVRRLIRRLHHPSRPLSRNRHFHTFETPEGRRAMRTSRFLRSLQRDILACHGEGRPARFSRRDVDGQLTVELTLDRVKGRRVSVLESAEFELLSELPGVREALQEGAAESAA